MAITLNRHIIKHGITKHLWHAIDEFVEFSCNSFYKNYDYGCLNLLVKHLNNGGLRLVHCEYNERIGYIHSLSWYRSRRKERLIPLFLEEINKLATNRR